MDFDYGSKASHEIFTEDDDEDFRHSLIMECLFESIKATNGDLSDLNIPSCKLTRTHT